LDGQLVKAPQTSDCPWVKLVMHHPSVYVGPSVYLHAVMDGPSL
jgi:hypothetical protein